VTAGGAEITDQMSLCVVKAAANTSQSLYGLGLLSARGGCAFGAELLADSLGMLTVYCKELGAFFKENAFTQLQIDLVELLFSEANANKFKIQIQYSA
jgi:hypothetical protein